MKTKSLVLLAAGLFFLSLLAGCGSQSGSQSNNSGGSSTGSFSGVAVDPYIQGARFQEIAPDGTVLQDTAGPSDSEGRFTFSRVLTPGSTVRMKIGSQGLHQGFPYRGLLSRKISQGDGGTVVVSPLTTLLASGLPAQTVLEKLHEAGILGLTEADLMENPMTRIAGMGAQADDADLELLQANMAINTLIEKILDEARNQDGFDFQALDDRLAGIGTDDMILLHSLVASAKEVLNQANLTEGTFRSMNEMIGKAVEFNRDIATMIRQHPNDPPVAMGDSIRNAVQQKMTAARTAPASGPDGPRLYADFCGGCHKPLGNTTKPGRSAAQIQAAINNNIGNMGFLKLTPEEIQAVADSLPAALVADPTLPPDGGALYASACAGCHGALASSSKAGATASRIQVAIDNNIGGMGFISMTVEEVQAVADALTATGGTQPTTPDPGVSLDGNTLYASSCAGCHGALAGTNKPGATAFQIQGAIDNNIGNMGFINLTGEQIQAIADVLPAAPVVDPTLPPDGAALYASSCAGCHNALATTNKPGRTAAQIQSAIDNNAGGMGFISLTAEEVQAIADVLPAAGATTPGPDFSNCTACHGQPPSGTVFPNEAGAHAVHSALPGVGTNCAICHTGASHNNQVDLGFPAAYNARSGAALDNLDGTCSNISCHGGQRTPDWWTGSINVDTQCASCHTRGTSQFNSQNSGEHSRHSRYSCTDCHNTAKMGNHFGNLATSAFETTPASTIGGGSTRLGSYSGGSCSSVQCHGNERW